jgi:hypothetical protein
VSGPVTPPPATQRIAESNVDSDADHPAEVHSSSASDSAARTGSSSHAASSGPAELDELAKQLYGRIRTELVAELRLDRERAGIAVGLTR